MHPARLMLARGVAATLLAACGPLPCKAQSPDRPLSLRVRAYGYEQGDGAVLRRAEDVASQLLAAAGLHTVWRICTTSEACRPEESAVPEVVVHFSRSGRPEGRYDCGRATLGPHVGEGTVTVSVPCVAHLAARLARRIGTRADPMFALGKYDDLVGAIVAHEIGHVLGLRHGSTGLMRATLDVNDIMALRLGRLAFSGRESARMRAAVLPTHVAARAVR